MDRFNPDHYLDKRFKDLKNNEPIDQSVLVDGDFVNKLYEVCKSNQINCLFLTNQNKNLSFKNGLNVVIVERQKNTINQESFDLNGNMKIIWVELNKKNSITYSNYNFNVFNNVEFVKLYVDKFSESNIKNNFKFFMHKESNLEAKVFSSVKSGYVLDDAIELIHLENEAKSNIDYYSFVKGKLVTQINTIIGKNALNNESHQNLKHVLLDKNAQCFSKPNLEISNNQVLSSHGNAISSVSSNDLFYLMQRGLNKDECLSLIQNSRLNEVISDDLIYNMILGV